MVRKALPIAALLLGTAGLLLSLSPSRFGAFMQACPYLQPDGPSLLVASQVLLRQASARLGQLLTPFAVGVGAPGEGRSDDGSVGARNGGGSGERGLTRAALRAYDGRDPSKPLLLGMHGDIFDVTEKGSQFYGPGAGYSVFAGRDSTRALAMGSLDAKDINNWLTDDFNEGQMQALRDQHKFYTDKYGPRWGVILEGDDHVSPVTPAPPPPPPPPPPPDVESEGPGDGRG